MLEMVFSEVAPVRQEYPTYSAIEEFARLPKHIQLHALRELRPKQHLQ